MFYHLLTPLSSEYSVFNVFRYITFRSAWAGITSLAICLVVGPAMIRLLQKHQIRERIRRHGPEQHQVKSGTPTMGGLLILFAFLLSTLLWANLSNAYIWTLIAVGIGFGLIGYCDDWFKLKHGEGLTSRTKMFFQVLLAFAVALFLTYLVPSRAAYATTLYLPFFKDFTPDIGEIGYIILIVLVIVGTSNAVNLTDGMDGLAAGCVAMTALAFTVLAYVVGTASLAAYLLFYHINGSAELAVLCGAVAGASMGFLWYNAYPAQVFMGDTGALPLGGLIGYVAIVTRLELMLLIVGGVFVLEALSVLAQVVSYRLTGRRILRCAPLHHHFHLAGWTETQTVIRFWLLAALFAAFGLVTMKLR